MDLLLAGSFIEREKMVANRYSEMGYREVSLDLDGGHVIQVKAFI